MREDGLKTGLWVGITLFLLAVVATGLWLTHITPEIRKDYQNLLIMSSSSNTEDTTYSSHQQRKNVRKNIYLEDGDDRLHVKILSDATYIDFETDGRESQVVEHLNKIDALMQEEKYEVAGDPMQVLREITAKEGTYYYKHNKFVADDVNIARYVVEGDTLPNSLSNVKPLMTGHAKSAVLNMDKTFEFTAQQMRATLHAVESTE